MGPAQLTDAHRLYLVFTAAATGGWRPAAQPAGQLAPAQKTQRVFLLRARGEIKLLEAEENKGGGCEREGDVSRHFY